MDPSKPQPLELLLQDLLHHFLNIYYLSHDESLRTYTRARSGVEACRCMSRRFDCPGTNREPDNEGQAARSCNGTTTLPIHSYKHSHLPSLDAEGLLPDPRIRRGPPPTPPPPPNLRPHRHRQLLPPSPRLLPRALHPQLDRARDRRLLEARRAIYHLWDRPNGLLCRFRVGLLDETEGQVEVWGCCGR